MLAPYPLIAALSWGRMVIIAVLVMLGYGAYGYWKGYPHGLGWAGFKIYAIWGWSGGRRLNELVRKTESDPPGP